MKSVDFRKIQIMDIEGNAQEADFSKQLGNQLYMQGHDIVECELGRRIYFATAPVELTDEECTIVRKAIEPYSYVARQAIEQAINGKEE
jgi:hypothetical protein